MAHVELSLSGAFVPQARTPAEAEFVPSVDRWTSTVAAAAEPCLVIDTSTTIVAVSASCSELLARAGVVRVVVACADPSRFAAGRGEERLRAAGVVFETGLLAEEAGRLYAGYRPAL